MKRVLLALLLSAPLAVFAESAIDNPVVGGSSEAGATKAAACAACHGPAGRSSVPTWPKLAGQSAAYLVKQLQDFKSGARKNPIMAGQVAALSEQDMKDLAAYFSAQKADPGVASESAIAVAQPIYRAGVAARGIPACAGCHGPDGSGNLAAGYPRLGGQHATYVAAQLHAYHNGERGAGATGKMMATIASPLTDAEIEALASYVNGLQ